MADVGATLIYIVSTEGPMVTGDEVPLQTATQMMGLMPALAALLVA